MTWGQTFATGVRAIAGHRLRSFLTALGILFGVAAVIATVGVGEGSQQSVQNSINSLGTNLITVTPGSTTSGGVRGGAGTASTLTMADATMLANHDVAPDVEAVAPVVSRSEVLAAGAQTWTTTVTGSTPDWLTTSARSVGLGAFFTTSDVAAHRHVVVLGQTTAAQLGVSVGDVVRIGAVPYQVGGILAAAGGGGFGNQDDLAVVPITVAQDELIGGSGLTVQRILLSATSADTIGTAYSEVDQALLQTHHVADPTAADFTLTTQSQFLATAQNVTQTLTVLLASVAAISLLVGGIGVMNIMLVSVTERIGEIGLRKALGATRGDILRQFLVEATLLSVIGATIGVLVGVGVAVIVPRVFGFAVALSAQAIVGAVVVAAAIGLGFGVVPAMRAARLAPIEALRSA